MKGERKEQKTLPGTHQGPSEVIDPGGPVVPRLKLRSPPEWTRQGRRRQVKHRIECECRLVRSLQHRSRFLCLQAFPRE